MRIPLLLLISFFLLQCNEVDKKSTSSLPIHTIDKKAAVDSIIACINSDELVEAEVLGNCWAKNSNIYPRFAEISSKLSDSALVDLTRHRKANIRAYAFWFLAKRQYKNIGEVYKILKNDSSEITVRYKNEQWIYKMPNFIYSVLTPNLFDNSTLKLNPDMLSTL